MSEKRRKAPWLKLVFKLWGTKIQNRTDFFRIAAATGDIVRIPLWRASSFIINDPDAISHILVHNETNYLKNRHSFRRLEPFIGTGLLTNSGEAWKAMRHQVQRKFYHKYLTQFIPIIADTTQKQLDHWSLRTGTTLDLVDEMSKLILEITSITLFGADVHHQAKTAIPLLRSANEYFLSGASLKYRLPTFKNRRYHRAKQFIDQLTLRALQPPYPYADQIEPALQCLWSQATDSAEQQNQHLGEAKNFLLAGHETTATTITWALYLLSKHPNILAELLTEIDTVLGKSPPTLETLDQLELTTMVIEETLRLYPPIWIFDRLAINNDNVGEFELPAKSVVMIVPYTLHRHPRYWTNPEEFNPQRFNKRQPQTHPKNAYLPFGAGPRVCIGKQLAMMMMKTVLPMILQRYELTINPTLTVGIEPLVSLKPDQPIPMTLKLRQKSYSEELIEECGIIS